MPAGVSPPIPAVSVVVPLFNGRDLITACLNSIPPYVEALVVDDGSTDGAPEMVEAQFPSVRVLRNPTNSGFATTANRGLYAARGRVRVVLNSDARLRAGALDRLAAAFADPMVGIAGPRLVFPDGTHQLSAARFPTPAGIVCGSFLLNDLYRAVFPRGQFPFEFGMARRDHDHDHDVDWVNGTCIALRDRCFEQIGGFDETYAFYAEETDVCWRAGQAGWQVRYIAGAVVEHVGGASSSDDAFRLATQSLRGEARFFAIAYGPASLRRWRAARLCGSAGKVVVLALPALVNRQARSRWRWQLAALQIVTTAWRAPPAG